jgi:hypothetical protein
MFKVIAPMMKYFLFLCSLVLSFSSQAQYSFSSLEWGDNLAQVETKLKTANFRLVQEFKDKSRCKLAIDQCSLTFGGLVGGRASFFAGSLAEVLVFGEGSDYEEFRKKLMNKYGNPLPQAERKNPDASNSRYESFAPPDNRKPLLWKGGYGDTIELSSSGSITYRASAANKATANKVNSVNF